MSVLTGLDCLRQDGFSILKGKRIAIVAHPASVDSHLAHIVDLIIANGNCEIVRLFGPEHGVYGTAQDMEAVSTNKAKKIEEISLYGSSEESLRPRPEQLADLDLILVDLQDIGARYYTYVQTLYYIMQAAKDATVKVIVLDRPNPIGGEQIEGSPLLKKYRSFCGLFNVPNRHGLTIGEFAKLMNAGFGEGPEHIAPLNADLEVIEMQGWKRSMYFDDTELPWVFPSPNMPTLETAISYPGTCLFEATTVSEGRGTTRPFELIGAPELNSEKCLAEFNRINLNSTGATLRALAFKPMYQKHAGNQCCGFQIHLLDRKNFKPYRFGLSLLASMATALGKNFSWRKGTYEFIDKIPAIDLLYGTDKFRKVVDEKAKLSDLIPEMEKYEAWFGEARKPYLIYK